MTTFTPDQKRCLDFLSEWLGGEHHLPPVHEWGRGLCINIPGCKLSTYDFDRLTVLILLAHKRSIRVELGHSGPGLIRVICHARSPGTRPIMDVHPTLDDLISRIHKMKETP